MTTFIKQIDKNADLSKIPIAVRKSLTLVQLGFSYYNQSSTLLLAGKNEMGIGLKLNIFKSGGSFSVVFGIHYEKQIEQTPQIGKRLEKLKKDVHFTNGWLLFSWIKERPEITVPDTIGKPWPVPVSKMGKGIFLSSEMQIKKNAKGSLANLNSILPRGQEKLELFSAINFSEKKLELGINWKGKLTFQSDGKSPLILENCGFKFLLSPKEFAIEAYGEMQFFLKKNYLVKTNIKFELTNNHVQLKGRAKSDKGIPVYGLKNVKINSLGILLGISFTPPSFQLAMQGKLSFRAQQEIKDSFGLQLAFSSAIPEPQYFAVDISKISLNEIIKSLGHKHGGRSYLPNKMVEIKALSFVWSTRNITLPDESKVKIGYSFSGLFTVNDWNAWFDFRLYSTCISGTGQLEPIKTSGIKISGKTKEIKRLHIRENQKWIPVSNTKKFPKNATTASKVMIKKGGALIQFSTLKSPYLKASFKVELFDIAKIMSHVEITNKGIKSRLTAYIPNVCNINQSLIVNRNKIETKGSCTAGLYVRILGKRIGLFINGNQNISTGQEFTFIYNYHYEIVGLTIPGLRITIIQAPKNFKEVMDKVIQNFWDNAYEQVVKRLWPFAPHPELNTYTSNAFWIDQIIDITNNDTKPDDELDAYLLANAYKQTENAITEMNFITNRLDDTRDDFIKNGQERLSFETARMEREIKDLKDENHLLRNAIRKKWKKFMVKYQSVCFDCFDAETQFHLTGKNKTGLNELTQKKDTIKEEINTDLQKLIARYDNLKGYGKNKWAKIAVDYYIDIIQIQIDAQIERNYYNLKTRITDDYSAIELAQSEEYETIICDLKEV